MRYAGLILNDVSNAGAGICVSFYTQGCPRHCEGCHNPETWDPEGGEEFTPEVLTALLNGITANNIQRNFCVLGGEPLSDDNIFLTYMVIKQVRERYPSIKIYLWTGHQFEDLKENHSPRLKDILSMIDFLIDGPYDQTLRDVTLPLRGSSNQRIIDIKAEYCQTDIENNGKF